MGWAAWQPGEGIFSLSKAVPVGSGHGVKAITPCSPEGGLSLHVKPQGMAAVVQGLEYVYQSSAGFGDQADGHRISPRAMMHYCGHHG